MSDEYTNEIQRLAEILSVQEYLIVRKGDGATYLFLKKLLQGPVPIAQARELGKNLIGKARAFMFNHGTKLTIRTDTGCYVLSIRQIREKA